jgi:hypothetical protein
MENEPKSFTGLARELRNLPAEQKRVALEMSAALAGVSLRVSRAFVEATPDAAKILDAENLRAWAEMGRKLAMANIEAGVNFFVNGIESFREVPPKARPFVFQICMRQLVLSSSIAVETFHEIPALAREVGDDELFTDILKVANEVAQRSAKHSADFLKATPRVADALQAFGDEKRKVSKSVVTLAANFASRTGGMTADLWQTLPAALQKLSAEQAIKLTKKAAEFLEYGGSVTLHFVSAGGEDAARRSGFRRLVRRAVEGRQTRKCRIGRLSAFCAGVFRADRDLAKRRGSHLDFAPRPAARS